MKFLTHSGPFKFFLPVEYLTIHLLQYFDFKRRHTKYWPDFYRSFDFVNKLGPTVVNPFALYVSMYNCFCRLSLQKNFNILRCIQTTHFLGRLILLKSMHLFRRIRSVFLYNVSSTIFIERRVMSLFILCLFGQDHRFQQIHIPLVLVIRYTVVKLNG